MCVSDSKWTRLYRRRERRPQYQPFSPYTSSFCPLPNCLDKSRALKTEHRGQVDSVTVGNVMNNQNSSLDMIPLLSVITSFCRRTTAAWFYIWVFISYSSRLSPKGSPRQPCLAEWKLAAVSFGTYALCTARKLRESHEKAWGSSTSY